MNRIQHLFFALIISLASTCYSQEELDPADHGGRNGGDGLEIQIELMAKKISAFLNTDLGRSTFPEINSQYLQTVLEQTSFTVTTGPLLDKYGVSRTCTNEPKKMEIICNVERWALVTDIKAHYVLVFHEILGLMNLELGHQRDVSMYPISSRLVNFVSEVEDMDLSTSNNRPEFSTLKNKSFGAEIISAKTGEKIRLICLDSLEPHKCQKFSYVRTYLDQQSPLIAGEKRLSQGDLGSIHSYLQALKRKAQVGKYEWDLISKTQSLNNFKGSIPLMGQKMTLKERDFTNLENLIILAIKNSVK